jgi:hypothetical protein
MRDAKEHLGALDLLDAPDVWEEALSHRPLPQAEVAEAVRGGRQRMLAGVVAIAVFGGAAVFAVQAFDTPAKRADISPSIPPPIENRGVWQPLPTPPIPFRQGAVGFWVDGRVVIVGGSDAAPLCGRFASCSGPAGPAPRDGAAYEPSTGTWTRIAASPIPVMPYSGAVLGDTVYVWGSTDGVTEMSLLAFNVNEDRWHEFPLPPGPRSPTSLHLTAAGDVIVAYVDSHERGVTPDSLFDPTTGEWIELPLDPLIPSFDRSMVWTGRELLLIASEVEPPQVASYEDRVATIDIMRMTWRRLPDSGTYGNPIWFWSAGHVVNPEIGHIGDNGAIEGTGPPYGGIFDPSSGEWSELPPSPPRRRLVPYGGPSVGGDRYVVTEQGAILDVANRSWEALPVPPVAADEQAVAVWAGDRLIVWGGYRWDRSYQEAEMVNAGWSWIPGE